MDPATPSANTVRKIVSRIPAPFSRSGAVGIQPILSGNSITQGRNAHQPTGLSLSRILDRNPRYVDFLREAPHRTLPAHEAGAPTEGSRPRYPGTSFLARRRPSCTRGADPSVAPYVRPRAWLRRALPQEVTDPFPGSGVRGAGGNIEAMRAPTKKGAEPKHRALLAIWTRWGKRLTPAPPRRRHRRPGPPRPKPRRRAPLRRSPWSRRQPRPQGPRRSLRQPAPRR
jgi:hypothetical protein